MRIVNRGRQEEGAKIAGMIFMRFGIVQQFWNAVGDGDRMLVTVQFTELLRMLNFFCLHVS